MLEIRRDEALGPDALRLIQESEEEQAAIYPPEVRYAFSPAELLRARVIFLVGYADGFAVAAGGVSLLPGYGELKRIFVTRKARGKGHARSIVTALEDHARTEGVALMRLETGQDSPEALRLYAAMGYVRTGPFGTYEENGSSIFMEKRL